MRMIASRPRVVVTGMGVVTPLPDTLDGFWKALTEGRSGIGPIRSFDASQLACRVGGEIPHFDPTPYIPAKQARRMSRASQMALVSAVKAVSDAGLTRPFPRPERVGIYMGTAIGGFERGVEAMEIYRREGMRGVSPFALPSVLPNMLAFHIAQTLGAKGPSITIATACATGTQAIGEAMEALRNGRADVIIAGGAEAVILEYIIAGFILMRAMPTSFNDEPQRASRPFDARREGFVLSEGAACLVLETYAHARSRQAPIYAEVLGYASANDGFNMVAPNPEADGPIQVMSLALQDAGRSPEDVEYINAHGSSTPANDREETVAIKRLFGEKKAYQIPISSTKSMLGHAMGASGAIEAVATIFSIHSGIIHPTINYETPDPECDLDYVPNQARHAQPRLCLSNSFGLGSQSACLVLAEVED
jgi:3-oxoacyl-[acyl-carrier-protein] synthase II